MSKYSNELQIEIDDVYGCPGHCPGCVLSNIERKSIAPDMDMDTLKNSISKLNDYIPTLNNIEKLNLTYGIADHFLMSDEYLAETFKLGSTLFKDNNLNDGKNGIFYSASMIGKHEKIMNKVKALWEVSKTECVPFYVLAVLDPKNLLRPNFAETYKKNIIKTNELIGRVDLSINLSEEAITLLQPKDLVAFANENKFDEVTINWVPTKDNINYSYNDINKLGQWLLDFDCLIRETELTTSYRPVIIRTINNLNCKEEKNLSLNECIDLNIDELVKKSLQIDHLGNIFPKFEAVGDIAHNPRIGIAQIGNVNEEPTINELWAKNRDITKDFIYKQMTNKTCLGCEYINYCAISGFHIYNWVLNSVTEKISDKIKENIRTNNCPHVAKRLFSHYQEELESLEK